MSYDVSLYASTDEDAEELFGRNHTSNTAIMWRNAGCDIVEFHDKPAADMGAALTTAVEDMTSRREHYAQWNPPNGWGSVETTIEFLTDLRDACQRFPDAIVWVSR